MEAKTCKQCGLTKPIEMFRKYYGGRAGNYSVCLSCEKINSRCKYLARKPNRFPSEELELQAIYALYDKQRSIGLKPPRPRGTLSYELTEAIKDIAPAELQKWLTAELTLEPTYYIEVVYEGLKKMYMPVKYIDQATYTPIYDKTYEKILNQILERFYEYEDSKN